VPTKVATAPTTVATLAISVHRKVDSMVMNATRMEAAIMIQKPCLTLSRSTYSTDVRVVSLLSPENLIASSSFCLSGLLSQRSIPR
jgi:hypothetical protein